MDRDDPFDRYIAKAPSQQNAVDALPGWITAFPPATGIRAGTLPLAFDTRISWAAERLGGVAGARVLELGPLDGGHTYMLHEAGAARIDAVEANSLAYLRCLVLKEILGLSRARFHLGDFTQDLSAVGARWDVVIACGVLYHLSDPAALLLRLAAATDALYIWTHVFDAAAMPPGDPRRGALTGAMRRAALGEVTVELHERSYHGAERAIAFCGGPRDRHVWMDRTGLLAGLRSLGFSQIEIAHDQPDAPAGPALSILARRPGAAAR